MLVEDRIIEYEIGERASKRYWIAEGKTGIIRNMVSELQNFVAVYKEKNK